MKNYIDKYLIILWIAAAIGLLMFLGHTSNILIDVGREVYYPERILEGSVLYKDIFNIYGALPYQINALLYKIFGIKLLTLYISGAACSYFVITGIYLLSKEFLPKILSFAIAFFAAAVGIFSTSIFNFHFPYSWAVLYGLTAFVYSLLFLVRYETSKLSKHLCISAFLAGVCAALKYDFVLYTLIILFFILKNKDIKAFFSLIFAPLLSFGLLFVQGLKLDDILTAFGTYSLMAKSETLKYFYQNSGVFFHPKSLPTDFVLLLKFVLPVSGLIFSAWIFEKKRALSIFLGIVSAAALVLLFSKNYVFGFLPVFVFGLTAALFKKLDTRTFVLSICVLSVSVKVFWVLLLGSYGNYYAAILILACLAVIFNVLPKINEKVVATVLISMSCFFMISGFLTLQNTKTKIETEKGTIYTTENEAKSVNELIEFLKGINGKAVIFPEGLMINFLADVKSEDYYNSLLPLYIETFTEKRIIEHFEKEKPEYIVLSNLDMKDYYFRYICTDYAFEFCGFVKDNYELVKVADNEFRGMVFRRINAD